MAAKKSSKKKEEIDTELIRVDKATLDKVRSKIKTTRQTIGGFYTLAAEKELKQLQFS